MNIPEGTSYSGGELTGPSGQEYLSFPVDVAAGINVDLHNRLLDIGSIQDVDTTNLPDSVTIDGTVYPITHEEDSRQELIDAVNDLATGLGITTAKAKIIMKAIYKVIKAARYWE